MPTSSSQEPPEPPTRERATTSSACRRMSWRRSTCSLGRAMTSSTPPVQPRRRRHGPEPVWALGSTTSVVTTDRPASSPNLSVTSRASAPSAARAISGGVFCDGRGGCRGATSDQWTPVLRAARTRRNSMAASGSVISSPAVSTKTAWEPARCSRDASIAGGDHLGVHDVRRRGARPKVRAGRGGGQIAHVADSVTVVDGPPGHESVPPLLEGAFEGHCDRPRARRWRLPALRTVPQRLHLADAPPEVLRDESADH